MTATVLVVAKAPIPGRAKTRLAVGLTPQLAAELAAMALLDTLDAALAVPGARTVVAMTGALDAAVAAAQVRTRLADCVVIPQCGNTFGERLVAAHHDAGGADHRVVQIGMDTPQVTAQLLGSALDAIATSGTAALGMADDGGWWGLAVRDARHVDGLRTIEMSTDHTGSLTRDMLLTQGLHVVDLPRLTDVDTCADAAVVAAAAPTTRFGRLATALLARDAVVST
ncbi:DUF2064 domain-containing protein [Williamsia sp. CHRR-6]|uniref:TIGR04282 family arsenosugar biosynthesis glycosyltransferase n=1 Tax=Williamsia sp. CHRR-6 TaxID=2835871 RepID=UPI0027DD1093|nr:DUF2064 domain-containing protein [Williamsia sp. CHRR-6]